MTNRPEDHLNATGRAILAAVRDTHRRRTKPIADVPADHSYCVEDGQTWPCATMRAVDEVLVEPTLCEGCHQESRVDGRTLGPACLRDIGSGRREAEPFA